MRSQASTVESYLAELPEDRRAALLAVRAVILKNLPVGYEEGMQYGMIGYYVPHSVYPPGYHCDPSQPLPFAGLASQKRHMSIYLMCVDGDEKSLSWFREAWTKTGRKLDMGKSCVRFKRIEDVPLKVVGQVVRRFPTKKFIEHYERAMMAANSPRKRAAAVHKSTTGAKKAAKKTTNKMKPAKKSRTDRTATAKKRTTTRSTIRKRVSSTKMKANR